MMKQRSMIKMACSGMLSKILMTAARYVRLCSISHIDCKVKFEYVHTLCFVASVLTRRNC